MGGDSGDGSGSLVRVNVRYRGASRAVDVEGERTVGELKQQLFVQLAGLPPPPRQKLICRGEVLARPEQRVGNLCDGSEPRELVVMLIEVLAPATRVERYWHLAEDARVRMADCVCDAWRLIRAVSLRSALRACWRNAVLFVTTLLIPPSPGGGRGVGGGGAPHRPAAHPPPE